MRHKLLFVGDVVLQSQPIFSDDLKSLMAEQDIRCCNVEAPLAGFGQAIAKTGPLLQQRPEAATWLRELGFDLFAMANNHIFDYGHAAMSATIDAFGAEHVFGVGDEKTAYDLLVREVDGVRYGFVAYAENGYGALSGDSTSGYAWVNHARVNADLQRFKQTVDLLIAQVHAGVEMLDVPIPEWRERYRALIDAGADIVIAHHPHVLQGYECYQDKYIVYSLGNFYFDGISDAPAWKKGGVLTLEIDNGQLCNLQLRVVEKEGASLSLLPAAQAQPLIDTLNSKLADEKAYIAYVDTIALKEWDKHHANYYAKAFNGLASYSLKALLKHVKRLVFNRKIDYSLLWHNMEIESNFWIARRAIQKRHKKP
ncbi:CapA family protein [Sphingobacterium oryzagri]|uniref:CapA family protein n=1 Tax=Sphingobacterium oryzagri TaxID=3025669 RepID=A0ABY7WNI0_9SPHI|nr:CapA family protein [Sphingobacterium sp. KACC 22765]WDF68894.1 CapA family protein [Sphingobacterium sp. KACC 22765]